MRAKKLPDEDFAMHELLNYLNDWSIPTKDIDAVHDSAKTSFGAVKDLTEYQDGKASRLLTIIAFLSAAIAAVFTRFAALYPWPGSFNNAAAWYLPTFAYVLFFLYLISAAIGLAVVVNAIRPQFNIPKTWTAGRQGSRPKSMLFFEKMLDVSAADWGETFQDLSAKGVLKETYAKNYIYETRLIAQKVATKLNLLQNGTRFILCAVVALPIFFVICLLTMVLVPSASGH